MTDRTNQRANRDKPNQGQDKPRTYVNPETGELRDGTQRQFRNEGWAKEGFVNQDDAPVGVPVEELPPAEEPPA
jgi:hypothetical protein